MQRVLFLSHSTTWGGAEKCLHQLVAGLPRGDLHPLVAVPGPGEVEDAFRSLDVETRRVSIAWCVSCTTDRVQQFGKFAHGLESRVRELELLLERERIDLVYSNTSVMAEGALAAASRGLPHVWHVHEKYGSDPLLLPVWELPRFYRLLDRMSERLVVVAECLRREMIELTPDVRPVVVPNGVGPAPRRNESDGDESKERLFGVDAGTPVILFVGAMTERKGVDDLLTCVPAVLARSPRARFFLVGSHGDRLPAVHDRIQREGLAEQVHMLGMRQDVPELMAASDVFVLPSRSDPFPMTALEAMSAELPIVATRSGGVTEMVEDRESALLVAPQDPLGLAAALAELIERPETGRRLARAAQARWRERFHVDRYVEDLRRVIVEALQVGPAPSARDARAVLLELQEAGVAQARAWSRVADS